MQNSCFSESTEFRWIACRTALKALSLTLTGANQGPLSLAFEHLTYPIALNLIIGSPLVRRVSSPLPLSLTPALLFEARKGSGSVRKYLMEIALSIRYRILPMSPFMSDVVVYDAPDPHHNDGNAFALDAHPTQDTFNPAQAYVLTLGAGQSRNKVVRVLNGIAQEFGHASLNECPWEKLNYDAVLAFRVRQMGKGLSPSTVNLQICTLRMVAKQAWLKGMMSIETYSAIREVKSVRGSRVSKGRALNTRETGKLIAQSELKGTAIGVRDAAIIALAVGCGMRRAEIATLKLQNINHQTRVITILGKGNKERKVAPSDDVWCRLEDWLKVRGEEGCENVFVAVKKGDNIQPYWAITASAIYQLLKSRAGDSQVSAFTPHDLRRTFATRLLESGADINTVRQAMGHASIITTQRYDKRDEHRVEEATRRVPL